MSWTETYETEEQTDQPTDAQVPARINGEQPPEGDDASESVSSVGYPLEMTRCPVCDGTEFVAKKLVYEEMGYTEDGKKDYHQARVRAEFELTCQTCGQRYHELPAPCRTFYSEVAVLNEDFNAACTRKFKNGVDRILRFLRIRYGIDCRDTSL